MKIAACTSNGREIDLHFGRTDYFYIYEVEDKSLRQLEIRNVQRYCAGYDSPAHGFQTDKFNKILAAVRDCSAIFTVKIGDAPKNALLDHGISIVEGEVAITAIPGLMS